MSAVEVVFSQTLVLSYVLFSREIKLRRNVEDTGKQLETERVNLENALRHIAQEQEDLKKLLEREQEQCRLKDELYREQKKNNEAIILESQKVGYLSGETYHCIYHNKLQRHYGLFYLYWNLQVNSSDWLQMPIWSFGAGCIKSVSDG